jgi:ammonia channel protein AmtB
MVRKLFPGQLDTEKIYICLREHWFRFFLKLLIWVIIAVPYVFLITMGNSYFPQLFKGQVAPFTALFLQLYLLLLVLIFFIIWALYYLNLYIITNIRVVDIHQTGLFKHELSELNIDKVEDVTSDTTGIFGTIFSYGNVYIQTAGAVERFEFINVPNPSAVVKLILDLYEKEDANSENRTPRT